MLPTPPCRTRVCRMTFTSMRPPVSSRPAAGASGFRRITSRSACWFPASASSRCASWAPRRSSPPTCRALSASPFAKPRSSAAMAVARPTPPNPTTSLMPRTPAPPTARQFPARADSPGRPCESSSPDASAPRTVVLCPPQTLQLLQESDALPVKSWLARRGFLLPEPC